MQHAENVDLARKWFDAFNIHDTDMLLGLYHDDACHYSPKLKHRQPETNGLIHGKDKLRNWWQDAFDRLPELHYSIIHILADEEFVFMEYLRIVPGEADMNVMEVLEINGGLIKASRVYHS